MTFALFPLAEVKALVRAGDDSVEVAVKSGLKRISPHIEIEDEQERDLRAFDFACDVVLGLKPNDFAHIQRQQQHVGAPLQTFDVYGPKLPADFLRERHVATHKTTWFVKLQIRRPKDGRTLYVISCHCLLDPLRLASGQTRQPEWRE